MRGRFDPRAICKLGTNFFQSLDEIGEPDLFKHETPRLTPVVLPEGELCYLRLIERTIVGVDWNYRPNDVHLSATDSGILEPKRRCW